MKREKKDQLIQTVFSKTELARLDAYVDTTGYTRSFVIREAINQMLNKLEREKRVDE